MSNNRKHSADNSLASGPPASGFEVRGRLWVEKDGQTFLSWGRVVLLERIAEHGSVSAAARSMGMGYRHAWSLVDQMNRLADRPLVEKKVGGAGGGGALLTDMGKEAVRHFWGVVKGFQDWMSEQSFSSG